MFKKENRKQLLIGLTILEITTLAVVIIMTIMTWDFYIEVAIDGLTESWIGTNPTPIEERYDVPQMMLLSRISTIAFYAWVAFNIMRFIFIAKKYKLAFGIGAVCIAGGIFFGKLTVIGWLMIIVGAGAILYSHWLGKEYKVTDTENKQGE